MATLQAALINDEEPRIKHAQREVRMGFIRKVYGILSCQLLVTVVIAGWFMLQDRAWILENRWLLPVASVLTMGFMVAMTCCRDTPCVKSYPTNYLLLFGFTALEGIVLGMYCSVAQASIVLLAAGLTVGIFLALTCYAFFTTSDFTGAGPYLMAALFVMLGMSLVITLLGFMGIHSDMLMLMYSGIGVLLFSFYIVYDTQLIIGCYKGHEIEFGVDDYCAAALALYLDIINLFLFISELLQQMDGGRSS